MLSRPALCCFALGLAIPFLLAGCQASSGAELPEAVRASAFVFEPDVREPPELAGLEFRAGFVLASGDPRLGGLSGLWIAPDGERLIAASDRGTLWLAEPQHADDGTLIGLAGWRAVEPATMPGDPAGRDAEALAATRGDLVIAFEGMHRLRRVPLETPASRAAPLPTPPGLEKAHNRGMEALVALPDGALLAIAEGVRTPGGDLTAWMIADDRTAALAYAPAPGFAPTGADRLDDTIYVLERRFSLLEGLAARVVALDAADVRPGARLVGRELGSLRPPAISENFEGIAARRALMGACCSTCFRMTTSPRCCAVSSCNSQCRVHSQPPPLSELWWGAPSAPKGGAHAGCVQHLLRTNSTTPWGTADCAGRASQCRIARVGLAPAARHRHRPLSW